MPLQIVNCDITAFACDAIVNPTDPAFSGSGGVDLAVHTAAGPKLDEACAALGTLHRSEVAVTDGFDLPCRYVLHTVGPVWHGGNENEEMLLRGCYVNALLKTAELNVHSVAFPLISSGTFGFPKDRVLRIALTAIENYLNAADAELDVTICILDRETYEVSLGSELASFLRAENVPASKQNVIFPNACESAETAFLQEEPEICFSAAMQSCADAAPKSGRKAPKASRSRVKTVVNKLLLPQKKAASKAEEQAEAVPSPETASAKASESEAAAVPTDLSLWLKQHDDSFAVTLLKLIDSRGMTDVQCYKRANVSRKTFYKINNDADYRPSKPTVIAFAISLKLSLEETEALLRTVGFSLSHSNTFDMIIEFYIRNGVYDINEINAALFQYDQVCLGC